MYSDNFAKTPTPIMDFPHKLLRAEVICDYVANSSYDGVVVLTCGNAGKALKEVGAEKGVSVVVLQPDVWYSQERISKEHPNFFDATSGHLPLWLMQRIADRFKRYFDQNILGGLGDSFYFVPTGSGETIIELRLAYPSYHFIALYNWNRGSQFDEEAPLNNAVDTLFPTRFYE